MLKCQTCGFPLRPNNWDWEAPDAMVCVNCQGTAYARLTNPDNVEAIDAAKTKASPLPRI